MSYLQVETPVLDHEMVAWSIPTLYELINKFEKLKKSKVSHSYDLQQTLQALYDELLKRSYTFSKAHEKGKIAIMKEYYSKDWTGTLLTSIYY